MTDVDQQAIAWVHEHHPEVTVVADAATLVVTPLDVYAPCALGGALDDEVAATLRAEVVCGGANNQLAHDRIDNRLAERGIIYCPDYLVNAGGVIQVADERHGFDFERAKAKARGIHDTLLEVVQLAEAEGITPNEAADRLAERRMAAVAPPSASGPGGEAERHDRSPPPRHLTAPSPGSGRGMCSVLTSVRSRFGQARASPGSRSLCPPWWPWRRPASAVTDHRRYRRSAAHWGASGQEEIEQSVAL